MYWKYVKKKKRNIVFCLILTELFLLKYIYKHIMGLPVFICYRSFQGREKKPAGTLYVVGFPCVQSFLNPAACCLFFRLLAPT